MLKKLRRKALRKYFDYANRIKCFLEVAIDERGISGTHSVTVIPTFRTSHVFIRTSRPGLIIGRQGKTLQEIHEMLERHCGKIKIHIRDFDPFYSR